MLNLLRAALFGALACFAMSGAANAQCNGLLAAGAFCGNPTGASAPARGTTAIPGTSSTFIQPVTGAATLTMQGKAQQSVNVLDFTGADSTGTTDNAATLRQIVADYPSGVSINIGPGTFNVGSTVQITGNINIQCAGPGATTIVGTGTNFNIFEVGNGSQNPNNNTISGCSFAYSSAQSSGYAIRVRNAHDVKISNIRCTVNLYGCIKWDGGPGQYIGHIDDFEIGSGTYGIVLGGSEANQIGTSTTSVTVGTGSKTFATQSSLDWFVGQNIRVRQTSNVANYMLGTVTSYSGTSIVISAASSGGSGTITDWTILPQYDYAQEIWINDGTISSTTTAAISVQSASGVYGTNVSILSAGTGLQLVPGNDQFANGFNLTGYTLDTSINNGLKIAPSGNGYVYAVQFNSLWASSSATAGSTTGNGIYINGSGAGITGVSFNGCNVFNNAAHGIRVENGTYITFANCQVGLNSQASAATYSGYYLGANLSNWSITGGVSGGITNPSLVTNNQAYGVFIAAGTGDQFAINGVNLTGNMSDAISDGATGRNKQICNNLGLLTCTISSYLVAQGTTGGTVTVVPQAVASGSLTWPNATATLAAGASLPIVESATTGNLTCPTCATATLNTAALTASNDTNVTLTLGGSPTSALLNAASIAAGWTGTLANSRLATMATNTVKGNSTSGTASPTDLAVGSCSTSGSALIWTTNTGFGCNTAIAATTVTTNANLTGVITSSGNATSIASQTGTGTKFVVDTAPTLVTPVLGAATGTSLFLGGGNISDSAMPLQLNAAAAGQTFVSVNKAGGYGFRSGFSDGAGGYTGGLISVVSNDPLQILTNNTLAMTISNAQAVTFASTISAVLANVATTSAVCYNTGSGLFTYDGTLGTCNTSDERLKVSEGRIPNALVKLLSIDGIYFHGKDETTFGPGRKIGLLAQNVEKQFPELVSTGDDGMKSLAYDKLTAPIIEAIRELKADNDNLRSCNDNWKCRLFGIR